MKGPGPSASRIASTRRVELRSAGDEKQRIEIALHRKMHLQSRLHPAERQARVAADRIDAGLPGVALGEHASAAREADHGRLRRFRLDLLDEPLGRSDAPALELVLRQAPGPAVEDLQGTRAGLRPG